MQKNLIGIISDTHDNRASIHRAVEVFNEAGCSLVMHCGDYVAPFTVREFSQLACPLVGVFGNNDGEREGLRKMFGTIGTLYGPPHEFTHGGRRIVMMHEPYFVEEYQTRGDVDVIVYGHTHEIVMQEGHPLVLNPGECCSWLTGRSTVMLLDPGTMEAKVVDVG